MEVFKKPLTEMAEYEEIIEKLHKETGIVEINGCSDSQKLHMIYGLSENYRNKLIVTYSEQKARSLVEDYSFYDKNVAYYPARDLIFYQADIHGNQLTKERIKCLKNVMSGEPATVVTTFDALMEHLAPLDALIDDIAMISTGDEIELSSVAKDLVTLGYYRNYQVEDQGQFSIHGGILDIFPFTEDNPIRIELWGDEVDSIRSFDLMTQRSLESVDSVMIYPCSEMVLSPKKIDKGLEKIIKEGTKQEKTLRDKFLTKEAHSVKTQVQELKEHIEHFGILDCNIESYINYFYDDTETLLTYFESRNTLVVLDEPARLKEMGDVIEAEFTDSMMNRIEKGLALPSQAKLLYRRNEIFAKIANYHTAAVCALPLSKSVCKVSHRFSVVTKAMNSYNNSFETLLHDLKRFKKNGYRVLLISASRTRAMRLCDDLMDNDITSFYSEDYNHEIKPGEVMISYGRLRQGFEYPLIKYVVISESDIFTTQKKKKKAKKHKNGQSILDFSELSVGDYVIHESHGMGVYEGIEQVTVDKVTKDYMKIRYRDGGNLFIPATSLDSIQKYSGKEGTAPRLNKLGGTEWTRTRQKVKAEIDVIANDLVELYAARREKKGFMYGEDTVWQREFEERFPFEETDDQLRAIEDTKRDMESNGIMDRLICGDVGYGKTEIAIRAAFKAVQEGKQVVYLVPTTILAQQHYNTFTQRMKDYPVRIELLCRFRTAGEIRKALEDTKKGLVDIIIGTHRVLSKDVAYKDLGLLIIDEEQRFGVRHKETIKQLKETVDVLTLTATPIPRTLHMSLIGIRDMSVLEEAPQDRMPVQTFVMEYNDELVREAIGRELARNGQVFYVYNRVNTIADMAATLRNLLPEARIEYAHGQMKEHELEAIMLDFINGDIDVLVSTTIIETGLDISNVNTMIIHDSDQLGLSQLYQLRGRVGRSNRTAYAFMLYKKDKLLKEVAEKRLKAIRDFTELGSGYKIAMQDLEIRGAGNLLGERQSGHMEAIGYDLYCKMLNEAVKKKKGDYQEDDFETSVDITVDAFIPDEYILNEYQKIDTYKRIAAAQSEEERDDMKDELSDRFGVLPRAVLNLLDIAHMRILAKKVYITDIKEEKDAIKLSIYERAKYDGTRLPGFLSKFNGQMQFRNGEKPYFLYIFKKGETYEGEKLTEFISNLLIKMQELIEVQ